MLLTEYGWDLFSFENSGRLGCDAVSLGEWLLIGCLRIVGNY